MTHAEQHIPETAAMTDHDQIGLEFGLSPVDLPEDTVADTGGVRWFLTVIAVSSVLLAAFNSFAIDKWARQLETTATTGPIKDAAARWHETMQSFGLDAPLEAGRSLWKDAKEARFGEEDDTAGAEPIPPQP